MLAQMESSVVELDSRSDDAFIRKLSRFAVLSTHDRDALARFTARPQLGRARSDLVAQGDVPDGGIVILEGFACRYRQQADGRRQILAFLLPGDLCDVEGVSPGGMDHAIGTLTACTVGRVAPGSLKHLALDHPQVALALQKARLAEEAILREWLVGFGLRSAPQRLAHLFCELLVRLQAVGLATSDSFDLPLTQADLGEATGLSTVHVNRSLQTLRGAGLIQLTNRKFRAINLAGLRSMCAFSSLHEQCIAPSAALLPSSAVLGAAYVQHS